MIDIFLTFLTPPIPPWDIIKTFSTVKPNILWFYNRKKIKILNFLKIVDFFLKKTWKNMVFPRGQPRATSQDLKILSNYSFYIDTYPIWAKIGENGYYGCNLQFLVVYEIFWWNSDLFRALNFVNRSSGSKVMHKWPLIAITCINAYYGYNLRFTVGSEPFVVQ